MRSHYHTCTGCGGAWTLYRVAHDALPRSLRAGTFPALRYNYCGACGRIEVVKTRRMK